MASIKLTLDQAKKEAKQIYYSSGSLWWTHSDDDLKEATQLGDVAREKLMDKFLNDPSKPQKDKDRYSALMANIKKTHQENGHGVPTDPWGCPLFQIDADKWISAAENKPEHFKKYGIEAFMKTHHQNCKLGDEYVLFKTWDQVTEYLDGYYSVSNRLNK